MQRAIDREARRGAVALELRVGVAAGDVAWAGEDYSGTPVIEAQRLCAAASAGSILVADAVRLLAGSGTEAELEDAGELELRRSRASGARVVGRLDRPARCHGPVSRVARVRRRHRVRGPRGGARRAAGGVGRRGLGAPPRRLGQRRAGHRQDAPGGRDRRARPRAGGRGAVRPLRRRPVRARPAVRRRRLAPTSPPARSTSCASSSARARATWSSCCPSSRPACPAASPSRLPQSRRSSGCVRSRPPPRCWRPPARRRPCCSCSTTCTGPTTCRCCCCVTCCGSTPPCGCWWSPPTATPSPAVRPCSATS